ncbi:thiamine biosynthesis ThiS [Candidatus Kinetoplastibacterium desouzaii TCC079E]|uniref:Thiamine biosynthesis ThiS n=1 Tax=Candidatus Kinetoplastidibacterium desouzai TCC079E TaxID=1208919 RepID=M1LR51_9PROT|nr:sulfur carrier protein ThiS [Candidatus Kinetoplastibacterium desouzaii]AGF46641.1 thiamine biosynthesis ThiS [Candidatus Kinetoplastibacterium desouzaii TCC079E]
MNIRINGKETEIQENITIHDAIIILKMENKKIAIELNGNIISKNKYHETILKNGDIMEIVSAIGGG